VPGFQVPGLSLFFGSSLTHLKRGQESMKSSPVVMCTSLRLSFCTLTEHSPLSLLLASIQIGVITTHRMSRGAQLETSSLFPGGGGGGVTQGDN